MFSKYLFFLFFIRLNSANNLTGKLIFSHVIFRHGDRTPYRPYPTDPWSDKKFWPTDFGHLTNIGKMQQYELGKWLRNRYQNILSDEYNKDEIYVRSTDRDRTIMSALCVLAGLYQPKNNDIWNDHIKWQPIPVHTVPAIDDYIAGKKSCPTYINAYSEMKHSSEFQKINEKYKSLFDYLTKHSGIQVKNIDEVLTIYDTLHVETLNNMTLPEWTKEIYPGGDLKDVVDLQFVTPTYNKHLARLKVGPLIKEIFERSKNKTETESKITQSVYIFSGHDGTLANILNALGLFEPHFPPYSSTVLIELRIDDNDQKLISIFYKNTTETPEPLFIPKCGIQCPLDDMFDLYSDILPVNWENECESSSYWKTLLIFQYLLVVLGILVCICLALALLYFILVLFKKP